MEHYIAWLYERVEQMHRILKPSGSIFLHCDWHANAEIKVFILNKLFGENNFKGEIVWQRTNSHNDAKNNTYPQQTEQVLLADLSQLIEQSKKFVIVQANSVMTMLYWHVGKRINEDILQNKRADYGKQIVATVAQQLTEKYGNSYEKTNLTRMMKFAQNFPTFEFVAPLAQQLSWSHFRELIPLKTEEARMFYAHEAPESKIPFNIFKDPYFLDMFDLPDNYAESDLEEAILRELERFILEMGKGFAFVARQKRMIIDGEDFHLDLLFFHRNLKRLVAIDLKLGKFKAEYKGKMELYLKWLNRNERQEGENEPIGLLLCEEGNREQIELLEMHRDGIMVAEYWTALPPKQLLETKMREIIAETRELFERRKSLKN
jgi:predicted nuclease of restriction endonuclease-like (RecB) superfamily